MITDVVVIVCGVFCSIADAHRTRSEAAQPEVALRFWLNRERKKSVWADVRYTPFRNRQGHQQLVEHGAEEKCTMIFVYQQFSNATQ